MAKLIKANGEVTENFQCIGLEPKQKAVGGYIEVVYTNNYVIYCNEDGLHMNLPLNLEVSALCGKAIVGDCVVQTKKESREEEEGGEES